MVESHKGHKHSALTRIKISEGHKKRWLNPGNRVSLETRKKLSDAAKRRGANNKGFVHSPKSRTSTYLKKYKREPQWSPYLPDTLIFSRRPGSSRRIRWCASIGSPRRTHTHAKLVYEALIGPVPPGWSVHHRDGRTERPEDDRPDNLIAVTPDWNLRYFPVLAHGFGISEAEVTKAYEALVDRVPSNALFFEVTRLLCDLLGSDLVSKRSSAST